MEKCLGEGMGDGKEHTSVCVCVCIHVLLQAQGRRHSRSCAMPEQPGSIPAFPADSAVPPGPAGLRSQPGHTSEPCPCPPPVAAGHYPPQRAPQDAAQTPDRGLGASKSQDLVTEIFSWKSLL